MAGNVWEWVQDRYHDSYNGAPIDGSAWESPDSFSHVIRGGSWNDGTINARSAFRGERGPGFRCVLGFRPSR